MPLDREAKADARFRRYTRELPNGCVEWTGAQDRNGYGRFWVDGGSQLAHRWRWQRDNGPLDPKVQLDHYKYPDLGCLGPSCVLHVRPATARENTLRGQTVAAQHLATTQCPQEHAYDLANTYITRDGRRDCRACNRERSAARRAARKAAQQT
jgi:hypothetical protein